MALSRKYYVLIAKEINYLYKDAVKKNNGNVRVLETLMNNLAIEFENDNANFNPEIFRTACLKS
tara:strand:+ start:245 stop:436 length:192 start_codon:yes stop_codon:yes gene_type:complete